MQPYSSGMLVDWCFSCIGRLSVYRVVFVGYYWQYYELTFSSFITNAVGQLILSRCSRCVSDLRHACAASKCSLMDCSAGRLKLHLPPDCCCKLEEHVGNLFVFVCVCVCVVVCSMTWRTSHLWLVRCRA